MRAIIFFAPGVHRTMRSCTKESRFSSRKSRLFPDIFPHNWLKFWRQRPGVAAAIDRLDDSCLGEEEFTHSSKRSGQRMKGTVQNRHRSCALMNNNLSKAVAGYFSALESQPIRTKALTASMQYFLSSVIAHQLKMTQSGAM